GLLTNSKETTSSCPTCVHALQVVEQRSFDPRHIAPAFRLADMWGFTDLRAHLIQQASKKLDAIHRLVFAREFGLCDLVEKAYLDLCQRDEPLTSEEVSKLGYESSALIGRLREETCRRFIQSTPTCPPVQQSLDSYNCFGSPLSRDRTRRRPTLTAPAAPSTARAPLPSSDHAKSFLVDEIKGFVDQKTSSD
ncbi:hypothetical protein FRC09_019919, partial [Ceratobasidium sp. 395]